MMRKRSLGNTDLSVTEIGLGAWPIGGSSYGDVGDKQAAAVLEAYLDEGGNFIDTAHNYGESERRIGDMLSTLKVRDRLILATKTHHTKSIDEIPEIRNDLETSLRRMRTEWIDLYYIHSPSEDSDIMNRVLDELFVLREEGKIRYIGASIKGPNVTQATVDLCTQYIDTGRVNALQVIYSILRQKNRESIGYAKEHGVGIVARTALENGFLTGKYEPDGADFGGGHRTKWGGKRLRGILEEALKMEEWAICPPYHSLAQVALAFSLACDGVSTVIPGAKNRYQVAGNAEVGELPPIDAAILSRLADTYRDFNDRANTGSE